MNKAFSEFYIYLSGPKRTLQFLFFYIYCRYISIEKFSCFSFYYLSSCSSDVLCKYTNILRRSPNHLTSAPFSFAHCFSNIPSQCSGHGRIHIRKLYTCHAAAHFPRSRLGHCVLQTSFPKSSHDPFVGKN